MDSRFVVHRTRGFSVLSVAGTPPPAPAPAPAPVGAAGAEEEKEREWRRSDLGLEERYELVRSIGEECVQEDELRGLLRAMDHPVAYDGMEPSGRMHIAQGILRVVNTNKLTRAGFVFKFWVADWFAMLNGKMGGDLNKIKIVGEYMIEIWKAVGMDLTNVQFLWASEEINKHPSEYWTRVMEIARLNNLARIQRCCTIMGRKDSDELSAAQIFYPCMQCADIFFLKANVAQLGMDQRKVNMLAREYCDQTRPRIKHKPIILGHKMVAGLKAGQEKMSKSDPDSAIFMEDTEADVKRKIKKAFCPPAVVEGNPVMEYLSAIIFPYFGEVTVTVPGGEGEPDAPRTFTSYADLEAEYVADRIGPQHVKPALAAAVNRAIEPVRQHFANDPHARELLRKVRSFKVTR